MSVAEKITRSLQKLPESAQTEVLDFVEFLAQKSEQASCEQQKKQWAKNSLVSAMSGIEYENEPEYRPEDIKEHF